MADDSNDTPTPAASKPATPRRRAPRKAAAPKAATPKTATQRSSAKPKTSKDSEPTAAKKPGKRATATKPRTSARKSPSRGEAAIEKVGGKWGAAAIAGGVAAIGAAATAALLTLRGSTPKSPALPAPKGENKGKDKAHQPDGGDSSASFQAKIADENTIPE